MHSRTCFPVLALFLIATASSAFGLEHAMAGTVTKVDSKAKTIVVKTADGAEEVFKFTGHTAMHAAKGSGELAEKGAVDTYLAGKEGTHVVVRYSGEGAEKTATAVDDFGKDAFKVSKGTVTKADKAGHTVTVKTEDGAEETYRVAKDASIETGRGVVKGSEHAAEKGEKVTVHYTEEAGHKVAHFIKHM
jgi:arginine repressor